MTVPMGNNSAKRYRCYYDREGRQVGMDVEAVSVTSSPTLTAGSSGSNTRFFYDNGKNRVKLITKSGSAYYFVYDPTASIPAVVYEAVGNTAYMNVREPSGALISREKYVSGVYQYSRTYHFDGLGSTIALTDEDGVTTDTYSYDAWGNVTHTSGTTADNPYQYVGELGYYTHYQEPTLNLLQLGVRYYDPSTGRFTQIDPIKDGINWYGYAGGNPVNYIDTKGLRPLTSEDISRLRTLYNYADKNGISLHMINQLVAELKRKIDAVPNNTEDPDNLQAAWWAIDRLGNTTQYSESGYLDNKFIGDIPTASYKCNSFAANAYAIGADLGWGDDGVPYWRKFGVGTPWPATANNIADPNFDMGNFETVEWGHLKTGDIYAWQSSTGPGHCGLYLGMGVSISASIEGVRLANMYKLYIAEDTILFRRWQP